MNNFTQRTITGTVFVAVLLSSMLYSAWTSTLLFALITMLGVWEFYTLAEKAGVQPQKKFGTVIATISYLLIALHTMGYIEQSMLLLCIPLAFIVFIIELYKRSSKPFENIAYTWLGMFYIAVPFALLCALSFQSGIYHPHLMLGYFLLLWASDSGAYVFGITLGKTKLFERISPKKTWEGTIGGGLLSMTLAYVLSNYFLELSRMDWMVVSIIIVITGNLGDLAESMFKRSINVKDSGTLLPGHGGILDRFDAVFISAPFVFTYLLLRA